MQMKQNSSNQPGRSSEAVISWLSKEKEDLVAGDILISEQIVINRLIKRELELRGAFEELHRGLAPNRWQSYLEALINSAAFWNPDEALQMRNAHKRLVDINERVARVSDELSKLLVERCDLSNKYAFVSDDAYHIVDLIDRASSKNGHYQSFLRRKLQGLTYQYDLKYWPEVEGVIAEIGYDAANTIVEPMQEITQEAISSRKASRRDFVRAFFVALDERVGVTHRDIPCGFTLTDESLASLFNCSVDLVEDKLIDAAYVKGVRQSIRSQKGSI